jgi:hypothetical protein
VSEPGYRWNRSYPKVRGRAGFYPPLPMTSKMAAAWANAIAKALVRGEPGTVFLTKGEREELGELRRRLIEAGQLEPVDEEAGHG